MNYKDTPLYQLRFIERSNKQILVISFQALLRNHDWGLYFGTVQQILAEKKFKGIEYEGLSFDLSACRWIDPVPMMSILLSANLFKQKFKAPVNFKFAAFAAGTSAETDKALKFLATEGFIEQVFNVSESIYFGENKCLLAEKQKIIDSIIQIDTKLNYSNCTVIRVQLFNTGQLYETKMFMEDWLNERLDEAKVGLIGKESDLIVQDIVYKIKVVLDETLHNVFQHAYEHKDAWGAVYVRFRHGTRNKSISLEERTDLQEYIKLENEYCPRLDTHFVEENNGFVEVFILDSGVGVASTYSDRSKRIEFRHAIDEIFKQGRRRVRSEKRNLTAKGGLHLIYDLLQQDRDYICGYSDSQWIGDKVPFKSKTPPFIYYDVSKTDSVCASGLCWIVRLSMNSGIHLNSDDWTSWSGQLYENPVFHGYKDPRYSKKELDDFAIIDNRFPAKCYPTEETIEPASETTATLGDVIVLLTRTLITKIDVWENIEKALVHFPALEKGAYRTLIIGDIPEKEALTYSAALIASKIYREKDAWKNKVSDIILITQQFYVCLLSKHAVSNGQEGEPSDFTFLRREEAVHRYLYAIEYNKLNCANPANSIREYVSFIKSYDSYLFWELLSRSSLKKYLFINQQIKWNNNDEKINGYLNFSLTLTQSIFVHLYKLSLVRCYGLFHKKTAVMRNTDDLTIKLCEEFNSNLEIRDKSSVLTLYLGSVYGSGTHEKNALSSFPKEQNDVVVNFFIHPGVEDFRPRIALLNWPELSELNSYQFSADSVTFERIGKSHTIAPYGWRYFPIPRYREDGYSFYSRTPKETYADWQSSNNAIVTFGNVSYQGFTDLFRIDIKKAIEYSFKYKTALACYLMEEFSYALDVKLADQFESVDYFNSIQNSIKNNAAKLEFYQDIGIIVYPNHLNTSIAIGLVQANFKNIDVDSQLIPIDFTQSYHESNAYLISPLTLNRVKDALEKQSARGKNNVLFFDCTIVSGKTRKHVYHILEGLGAGEVKTLAILDRTRMPYSLPKAKDIQAFWRLDVPRLAYGDYNPINASLEEIASIRHLFTEPARKRFEQWQRSWSNSSLGIIEADNGIKPSRLPGDSRQIKKFGIMNAPPHDQIGGAENFIELVNSFGLSIYCAEAHAMTGRDDIALKIIQKYSLPPSIVIELIASQLLLFPHDFSRELRLEMLKSLFQASLTIEESYNHTSLAAIVLLRQEGSVITALFKEMFRIQNMEDSITNLDLRIAVAFLINKYGLKDPYGMSSYDSILIKNQDDSLWQLYKRFHSEIYEGKGKMHSRPILDIFSSEPNPFEQKLSDAIVSFSRLKSIFQHDIKEWFLRTNNLKVLTHSAIIKKMGDCYIEGEQLLEEGDIDKYRIFSAYVKASVVPFLQEVHNSLFIVIYSKKDSPVQRRLNNLIIEMVRKISDNRWSKEAFSKSRTKFEKQPPVILISSFAPDFPSNYVSHDKLWTALDRKVQEELDNLIYNAVYAGELIQDPHNPSGPRKAHMWIWIEYQESKVTFHFVNSIIESEAQVRSAVIRGQKDSHRHCIFEKALGGHSDMFFESQNDQPLIHILLTLPIL